MLHPLCCTGAAGRVHYVPLRRLGALVMSNALVARSVRLNVSTQLEQRQLHRILARPLPRLRARLRISFNIRHRPTVINHHLRRALFTAPQTWQMAV